MVRDRLARVRRRGRCWSMLEETTPYCGDDQRAVDAEDVEGKVAPVGVSVHAGQKLEQFGDAGEKAEREEYVGERRARIGGDGKEGRPEEGRKVKMAIIKAREQQARQVGDGQECAAAQNHGDDEDTPDRRDRVSIHITGVPGRGASARQGM